jgi:hypothetical protein
MTVPVQPPPTTSELRRVETEEGWKKVERRKGKGKREKKVGNLPAGSVPTWAGITRDGDVSVNVFIGRGAGYTELKTRRPAGRGRSNEGNSDPLLLLQ